MTITDILNSYNEMENDLEFQNTSSIQTKIMISLSEGSKNIKDLEKCMGIPHHTILNNIIELKKEDLIRSNKNNYCLSRFGEKIVFELIDTIKTFAVLKNNRELWLNHEIDSIPPELLLKIGDLNNSKLIKSKNIDVAKIHDIHTQVVLNSKKVNGVSPIFYSDYIKTFDEILKKNIDVELILTDSVFKKTIKLLNSKDLEKLKRLILQEKLKLWEIKEEVKVAFTVTDNFITFGVFSKNGMYDSTKNLISNDAAAIKWGNELFEYYLKKAKKINLEDLKTIKTDDFNIQSSEILKSVKNHDLWTPKEASD